jgi:hypothetical protein
MERDFTQVGFHQLPNKFFYYVAKKFLAAAYSPQVAKSFYSFKISRRQSQESGKVRVECFNGGGFIQLSISKTGIVRTGVYGKHRRVNTGQIVSSALQKGDRIPKYYYVTFREGMTTEERCITDIEAAKKRIIERWNRQHSTSPIAEPLPWVINEI